MVKELKLVLLKGLKKCGTCYISVAIYPLLFLSHLFGFSNIILPLVLCVSAGVDSTNPFSFLLCCASEEPEREARCTVECPGVNEAASQVLSLFLSPQNPDYLQYSISTPLCGVDSVLHKEEEEKMMDTV